MGQSSRQQCDSEISVTAGPSRRRPGDELGAALGVPVRPDASAVLALQRLAGNRATVAAIKGHPGQAVVQAHKRKAAAAGLPPPRTQPPRRRRRPNPVAAEMNWAGPTWGNSTKTKGGTWVSVDLGPANSLRANYGSTPRVGQCTAVEWLNQQGYGGYPWVKGHLLNDNLGGPGLSKNLTPVTHNANMDIKNNFESPVKNFLSECYRRAEFQDADTDWYGARVDVQVSNGRKWPGARQLRVRAVADHVTATAEYISKSKASGIVSVANQPLWARHALPAGAVDVDCVQ
jgi:hypothetical protein